MKSIAVILLFVFSGTIIVPLTQSLFSEKLVTIFIVDEEKSSSNQLNEIKETKHVINYLFVITQIGDNNLFTSSFLTHSKTSLPTSPVLEFIAPPPNFC
jgi:hypothetical protein